MLEVCIILAMIVFSDTLIILLFKWIWGDFDKDNRQAENKE